MDLLVNPEFEPNVKKISLRDCKKRAACSIDSPLGVGVNLPCPVVPAPPRQDQPQDQGVPPTGVPWKMYAIWKGRWVEF